MSKFKAESVLVVAILAICFALMVPSIVVDVLAGILHEGWFLVRSIVLILLGGCFMWLVYRLVKQDRRFRTKTFSEILDDMIGATM